VTGVRRGHRQRRFDAVQLNRKHEHTRPGWTTILTIGPTLFAISYCEELRSAREAVVMSGRPGRDSGELLGRKSCFVNTLERDDEADLVVEISRQQTSDEGRFDPAWVSHVRLGNAFMGAVRRCRRGEPFSEQRERRHHILRKPLASSSSTNQAGRRIWRKQRAGARHCRFRACFCG
jgi:hypothetical protein